MLGALPVKTGIQAMKSSRDLVAHPFINVSLGTWSKPCNAAEASSTTRNKATAISTISLHVWTRFAPSLRLSAPRNRPQHRRPLPQHNHRPIRPRNHQQPLQLRRQRRARQIHRPQALLLVRHRRQLLPTCQ